jgi:hypothetical protein
MFILAKWFFAGLGASVVLSYFGYNSFWVELTVAALAAALCVPAIFAKDKS